MHVSIRPLTNAELIPGHTRLEALVSYDDSRLPPEVYWFEAPSDAAPISTTGNMWARCLLPLAMHLGEPLRIDAEIDPILRAATDRIQQIWKTWFVDFQQVAISAPSAPPKVASTRVAAFFTAGIDSYFTVARHHPRRATTQAVDDLLFVWGYDVPLSRPEQFWQVHSQLNLAADQLGLPLVTVASNLRSTQFRRLHWGKYTHGSGLAAVAGLLEHRYSKILLGSSFGYRDLRPWGSHPLVDPLFSTSSQHIIHDGTEFNRVEKTRWLAEEGIGHESLRVCYRSDSNENCQRCGKCFRTMATLDILGRLHEYPTLLRPFGPDTLRALYVQSDSDRSFLEEVRDLAKDQGRSDYVAAINTLLGDSTSLTSQLATVAKFYKIPVVRRGAYALARRLLRNRVVDP